MNFRLITTAVLSLVTISATAHAGLIILNSQPGLSNSLTPATVAITPHPAWQPNNPANPWNSTDKPAVWISYAGTGYGDPNFQPYNGTTPVVSIFQSFTSAAGFLMLNVWADDTSQVLLDGVSVFSAVFSQDVCSGQPIGCRPADFGVVSTAFEGGTHELEFRLFQVGTGTNSTSNPFGLLFTGGAFAPLDPSVVTATPEPGTFGLGASILIVASGMKRWSRHREDRRTGRSSS